MVVNDEPAAGDFHKLAQRLQCCLLMNIRGTGEHLHITSITVDVMHLNRSFGSCMKHAEVECLVVAVQCKTIRTISTNTVGR